METKHVKLSPSPGGARGNLDSDINSDILFSDIAGVTAMDEKSKTKHHRTKLKKRPKLHPFEKRYSSLSEKNKLIPERKRIDYVLFYPILNPNDLDSSEKKQLEKHENYRQRFEEKLTSEGFTIDHYSLEDHVGVRLHCPFKRLCFEAERVKLEMPLKDCKIPESPPSNFFQRFIEKHLETDQDIADFVSAPFQMNKIHLFDGHENPGIFFRPSIRSLLVHHILINMDIRTIEEKKSDENEEENLVQGRCGDLCRSIFCCCKKAPPDAVDKQSKSAVKRRGLQYLLMKNIYTDSLVLHDESAKSHEKEVNSFPLVDKREDPDIDTRRELDEKWSKFLKFQPMWYIRNYFGEKVAFYFAWTGVLISTLWIPMLFGIAVFIYGLYESVTDTTNKANATAIALQDVLEDVKEAFDNNVTPFFALFICCWGTIFLEIWKRKCSTLAYEWDVDQFETNEPDRPQFYGTVLKKDPVTAIDAWFYPFKLQLLKFLTSASALIFMVCVVVTSVFAVIVYRVIMNIDYCPNMSNKECLLLTTIVSSILNAVSILILGMLYNKLAVILTDWENHRTQTSYDDSLIIKLFAFQFVNSYASCFYVAFIRGHGSLFEDRYVDSCEGSCMTQLSFQILTLMIAKPFPKFFKDIGLPLFKKVWRHLRLCCQKNQVQSNTDSNGQNSNLSSHELFIEQEKSKPDLKDFTMEEYTEKVILYGFLMLFACSFPLAPLMAILICLIDIRVDAKRLLWLFRRPVAHISEDIGMWYNILNFVNFVGVLTNAFIIAFTSSWGAQFNITGKLAVVIGFEHIVFILKFLLAYLIPDVPEEIKLAMRREKYLVQRKMEHEDQNAEMDFTTLFPLETIKEENSEGDRKNNGRVTRKKKTHKGHMKPVGMHDHFSTSDSQLVTNSKKSSLVDSVFHFKLRSPSFHKIPSEDPSAQTLINSEA